MGGQLLAQGMEMEIGCREEDGLIDRLVVDIDVIENTSTNADTHTHYGNCYEQVRSLNG